METNRVSTLISNGFEKKGKLRDFIGVVVGPSLFSIAVSAAISSTVFQPTVFRPVVSEDSFHDKTGPSAQQNFSALFQAQWKLKEDDAALEADEIDLLASGLGRLSTITEKPFVMPAPIVHERKIAVKKSMPQSLTVAKVSTASATVAVKAETLNENLEATQDDRDFMLSALKRLRSQSKMAILNHARLEVLAKATPVRSDQIVTTQSSVGEYSQQTQEIPEVVAVDEGEELTEAAVLPLQEEPVVEALQDSDREWIANTLMQGQEGAAQAALDLHSLQAPNRITAPPQVIEETEILARNQPFSYVEEERVEEAEPAEVAQVSQTTEPVSERTLEDAPTVTVAAPVSIPGVTMISPRRPSVTQAMTTHTSIAPQASRMVASTLVNTQRVSPTAGVKAPVNTRPVRPVIHSSLSVPTQATFAQPALPMVKTVGEDSPYSASHSLLAEGYEALEPTRALFGLKTEILSSEGSAEKLRPDAWIEVSKAGYVPLVTPVGSNPRYPLLSQGALEVLQLKAGMKQSERAGIVFGQVGIDYDLRMGGRADPVFFVDTEGQSGRVKTFVILNAEPGIQFMRLTHRTTKKSVGVALPVMAGKASALDATIVRQTRIRGRMLGADQSSAQTLNGVKVKVIGQGEQKADGVFDLSAVQYIPNFPVYIELEPKEGFPHRYAVDPTREARNDYFIFGSQRIQEWVGQLEGGVHPSSGLVVAAFSGIIPYLESKRGNFRIQPVNSDSSLDPESYVLGAGEKLLVSTPLSPENSIGIGAQVPEGLNQISIEDRLGKVKWNRWIPSSPGVISVSGDY